MSLAVVQSRAKLGIDVPAVSVEVHLSNGLPAFNIEGLPETSVKESKDRVRSAIINSYFEFPARRITVNLAPADIPKEGSRFDLAIAIGILAASKQIPVEHLEDYEFISELALSGEMRSVEALLPSAQGCAAQGKQLIVAQANADEAALVESLCVLPAKHLLEVSAHLHQRTLIQPWLKSAAHPQKEHQQLTPRRNINSSEILSVKCMLKEPRKWPLSVAITYYSVAPQVLVKPCCQPLGGDFTTTV